MRKVLGSVAIAAMLATGGCGIFKGKGPKRTPTVGKRIPILVSENEAEIDKGLADAPVTVPLPVVNDAWSQSGGNAAKSMGALALAEFPSRRWTASIDAGSNRQRLGAAPVIAENKVFVVDVDATLHAFDAKTGKGLWSTPLTKDDENKAARFGGGVSYDSGKVYATDGLGDVVALSAAEGKEIWRAKPGGPLRGAPTLANGQVYVLSQDNQLYALGDADGKVAWTQSGSLETQGVFGVAAPAASAGTVVAGFSSGELNAYRYENGRTLWQDALSRTSISTSVSSLADIDADPVIEDGRVYAVGQGGRMVAVDISTGQRLWEQNLAGISTPWIAGEWLFVLTDDARVICLSKTSGKVRWISQLRGYKNVKKKSGAITWFGPVLAGNKLWLTNSRGELTSVSPTDGAQGEVKDAGEGFSLPPVVANEGLYLLDQKGRLSGWH
jgi:outer membrane protein assembly factor BamB